MIVNLGITRKAEKSTYTPNSTSIKTEFSKWKDLLAFRGYSGETFINVTHWFMQSVFLLTTEIINMETGLIWHFYKSKFTCIPAIKIIELSPINILVFWEAWCKNQSLILIEQFSGFQLSAYVYTLWYHYVLKHDLNGIHKVVMCEIVLLVKYGVWYTSNVLIHKCIIHIQTHTYEQTIRFIFKDSIIYRYSVIISWDLLHVVCLPVLDTFTYVLQLLK